MSYLEEYLNTNKIHGIKRIAYFREKTEEEWKEFMIRVQEFNTKQIMKYVQECEEYVKHGCGCPIYRGEEKEPMMCNICYQNCLWFELGLI
jgi:hypothetical protein